MDLSKQTRRLDARKPEELKEAAALLQAGNVVAFPTETVYGLGANAFSPAAVQKIFAAKGRPRWDPLIVHVCDHTMLARVADLSRLCSSAQRSASALMERFWPGPLTLLLPRGPEVPDAITAGRSLVGVRMPGHPVALQLIRQAGLPLAAPSANRFGHTSPTAAQHVLDDLDGRIDAVLDCGTTAIGVESTVVGWSEELDDGIVSLYRPGAITSAMLEEIVGIGSVRRYSALRLEHASDPHAGAASPGLGLRHYAPAARMILVDVSAETEERSKTLLAREIDRASSAPGAVGVMLPEGWRSASAKHVFPWGPWNDGETLARRLFEGLRSLDTPGASIIICPVPQGEGLAAAIRDRLERAAR